MEADRVRCERDTLHQTLLLEEQYVRDEQGLSESAGDTVKESLKPDGRRMRSAEGGEPHGRPIRSYRTNSAITLSSLRA